MEEGKNPAIFLDRDGTIIVDKGYLHQKDDIEYLDGAVDAMRQLSEMGFLLVIITNQSGIARGYFSESEFVELDHWMCDDLRRQGVGISRTYYCPHCVEGIVPEYVKECGCRKPKTGLFWKAARELGIDMERSFSVGDRMRDLMICRESKVGGVLLTEDVRVEEGIQTCRNWDEILQTIISFTKNSNVKKANDT